MALPSGGKETNQEALRPPEAGDPGGPIQMEVERGMAAMIEQHATWLELCAAGQRGEEFDWRTAELLSCLRAIEWDLQDLEDAVSIVEGNRKKFSSLDNVAVKGRKDFIDTIRSKIDYIRSSVQASNNSEGHVARKGIALITAAKGYGKLGGDPPQEASGQSTPKAIGSDACASGSSGGIASTVPDTHTHRRKRAWYAWCC